MSIARPSTLYAISGAARRARIRTPSTQVPSTIGRRQYAHDVDGVTQVVSSSSKLPWILSAGALTAGGAYYYLQHQGSNTTPQDQHRDQHAQPTAQSNDSNGQKQREREKRDYEDDHPKPVEDRHGDSVKKHSMAAEKNQYKVRTGVFSGKTFDNHIQKREDNPADEFEEVDTSKEDGKKRK